VIVVPAEPSAEQNAEALVLAIPPDDPQPVKVFSLDEQPTAQLPARPEPVAASSQFAAVKTAARVESEEEGTRRNAFPENDPGKSVRAESLRLREEIKTLQAELDLMKTREQRTMRELQLVRSERDRLLSKSRRSQPDGALQKTSTSASPRVVVSPPGSMHTVAKGDTLWSIARRYGVTVDKLKEWNDLTSGSALKPGQAIAVRGSDRAAQPPTAQPVSTQASARHYQVQRGDTLYGISRRFNVSVSELSTWNNLQASSSLRVGQTLVVASAAGETS